MDEELRELIAALGAETVVRLLKAYRAGELSLVGHSDAIPTDAEELEQVEKYWWERPESFGGVPGAPTLNVVRINADD